MSDTAVLPRDTYKVKMNCANCGHVGILNVHKGVERPRVTICPNCGCATYKSE